MVDYRTEFEVVWHGAIQNDPLGGLTKGCLLDPREQTEDERARTEVVTADDLGLTQKELLEAVMRLNASLKRPLKFVPLRNDELSWARNEEKRCAR